ncbi:Daunorubicin/doxorubicin resistance ATP-binding protein DrrA [bacterium HR17]|uniref:Daunorubicin/doxorubicin resistance ATP-binding protein DrrA n=1 Tax=Candidatus Fervidibacter japonicus TaxID=2035412 RepID=A0A2H5XCX9_9BACT|nr:Daunorubicin/doxorubicin resistance ATP-binding protein DrrA [bacterium HR17]
MVAVQVNSLVKRYGQVVAVKGVSFEVAEGEVFGLLGPNGAGKTTTVECMEGLRIPDDGTIRIFGHDPLREPNTVKELMGVQLQATALPPKIRVREALELFGSFYRHRRPVSELLRWAGLDEWANRLYDTLSGGQKQRLALALALVNDPKLVILDEPTAGLDAHARRGLHELILKLKGDGKTVLLTTHYIEEAERLCDRVAILDRGELIALDTPQNLTAQSGEASRVEIVTDRPLMVDLLRRLPAVTNAGGEMNENGQSVTRLWTTDLTRTLPALLELLRQQQTTLLHLSIARPTLEDVFVRLTGHSIE